MNRLLVTLVAVGACSLVAFGAFASTAAAQAESPTEIDDCTVVDESGEYELTEDVETDQTDSCIEIRADDVTIDGNGHVLQGPGADQNGTGIDLHSDGDNSGLVVRNVEIAGWSTGLYAGGDYELEDAVVRDNGDGLHHHQGGAERLENVTVENNDRGMYSMMAGTSGTDVTVRENGVGIVGEDGGNYGLESSRLVDNDEAGAKILHSSQLNLSDSTVSGNGGHGLYFPPYGFPVWGYVENTTVTDNGGDGIHVANDVHDPVRLVDVTVRNNDGHEVNANPEESKSPLVTATGLQVGQSATTAFDEESVRLEPVDRDDLPPREDATATGDGLNVSGPVDGPVQLELGVDADDETVDLWRHDGTGWETVEEDLAVSDGTVETSVDRNGTYATGTETDDSGGTGDDSDDSDGSEDDSQDGTDDTGDDSDGTDDTGDSGEDSDPSDDNGDKSTPTQTPSDDDGEKDGKTDTPTDSKDSSDCGCSAADGDDGESDENSTSTDEPTDSADDQQQTDETEDETTADADTQDTDDDDGSQADAPGFEPVVALVALLAGALLARRRE
ncbi:right-handed parallel beta-helix repeat-containing protein [Natronomonas salina]|uniref:right-handed parallel beta-helix repeat-containing protein n=1 Tax=Natronomonas salina TaxID=1710540 RepID=UPI0015B5D748|nr:right-handed parallel beta-helix repeat-containing protein [Natronomonas salina]QLD91182.1 right-handed parallel beta-helix repeat-containing protein [Natronomonas salina]